MNKILSFIFKILLLTSFSFAIDATLAVNATVNTIPVSMQDLIGYGAVYAPSTDNIYVWGGYNKSNINQWELSMRRYDMTDNTWYIIDRSLQTCGYDYTIGGVWGDTACPGRLADFGMAYNGFHKDNRTIIIAGGDTYEVGNEGNVSAYIMTNATWEKLAWNLVNKANFTLVVGDNEYGFAFGGCNAGAGGDGCTDSTDNDLEVFKLDSSATATWASYAIGPKNDSDNLVSRYDYSAVYLPDNDSIIYYGGRLGRNGPGGARPGEAPACPGCAAKCMGELDVSTLPLVPGSWHDLTNPGGGLAACRSDTVLAYDNESKTLYLGGGTDATGFKGDYYAADLTGRNIGDAIAFNPITYISDARANATLLFAKGIAKNAVPNALFLIGGNRADGTIISSITGVAEQPSHIVTSPLNLDKYVRGTTISSVITGATRTTLNVNQGLYIIRYGADKNGEIYDTAAYTFDANQKGTMSYDTTNMPAGWYTLETRVGDGFGFWETTLYTFFQIISPPHGGGEGGAGPDFIIPAQSMPEAMKTFVDKAVNGTLYEYAELNIKKLGTDFDLPIILTFSVSKDWFVGRDIAPEDLKLNWNNDGVWSELPTTFIEEKGSRYVYQTTLYTFSKYFAVAARTGDCRDFGCGENEKCGLVEESYYCIPKETSCNVVCPTTQMLDESTCICLSPPTQTKALEVPWVSVSIGALSIILVVGIYLLLTRKSAPSAGKQKQKRLTEE